MNFAVIGLGSFGVKRAKAIKSSKNAKLVYIFDPNKNNAQKAEKELTLVKNKLLNPTWEYPTS